ncbi:MAG TPA: hypothetical protein VIM21_08675 [Gemmatimonadaceae bacterium]
MDGQVGLDRHQPCRGTAAVGGARDFFRRTGSTRYLQKPFTAKNLARLVRSVLDAGIAIAERR